jgi:hypothetical protein
MKDMGDIKNDPNLGCIFVGKIWGSQNLRQWLNIYVLHRTLTLNAMDVIVHGDG